VQKQRIVVLSKNESEGSSIANQLRMLFGDIFDIDSILIKKELGFYILADLVLSTSYIFTSKFVNSLTPSTDVYVVRRTIMRAGWEKAMRIPPKTKVFVAGEADEAQITAATLCELGVRHLEFVTSRADEEAVRSAQVAITTNAAIPVPPHIREVINIGERVLDSYTLFDILGKMGQLNKRTRQIIINNMDAIMPRSPGFLSMISNLEENRIYSELLINVSEDGLIAFNTDQSIIVINRWAEKMFSAPAREWIGRNIKSIISKPEHRSIVTEDEITDDIFSFNDDFYIVNKQKLWDDGEVIGGAILFRKSTEIQRLERKVWQTNVKKGHVAKYRFMDIVGKSPKMQSCVSLARKMATGDSGLLIQGESGTGKELFAQAIHNSSGRRDKPFVAFNCAAVSDTLMESELFGYEEGAFTGAKKGGKAGLFETAHTGTIFLDEIGDISRNMQAGLLRVLQEKEIVRVGGTNIIPVDVRVLAASNQNLYQMVQTGRFRADLFYRLNIMSLQLPALRDRKEDIPYLVEYMLEKRGVKKDLPKGVMNLFFSYDWPGNVRELDNCVEYMVNISGDRLCVDDVPNQIRGVATAGGAPADERAERETAAILMALKRTKLEGRGGMGRRGLVPIAREYQLDLTENEIRAKIKKLEEIGLVDIHRGRGGTKISGKGEVLLEKLGYKYFPESNGCEPIMG
jgi:transcriptional regulator with PAS, ATPase and Fis domain